jgi:hypothetical protein
MATKRNQKLSRPQLKQQDTTAIDNVRSPNFQAALAQRDYQNLMQQQLADIQARNLTEQNAVGMPKDVGSLGTSRAIQTAGSQDFIDSRDPNKMYTQDMVDYIDPLTGEKVSRTRGVVPAPGSRFVPANQVGMYKDQRGIQNPIPIGGLGAQKPMDQSIYDSLRDYQAGTYPVPTTQNTPEFGKQFGQIPQGIGGLMPQIPQGQQQQMQNYQNFLNQGMNNIASMNQDSMTNFANMQPGMPTTEPAQTSIAKPTMPVAGFGMQKSKVQAAKPSTSSNTPARFV